MFLKTKKYQSDKNMGEKKKNGQIKQLENKGKTQRKSLDKDL